MPKYFTKNHFSLLKKWNGKKNTGSNPEQKRAYEELKVACAVTEEWANRVKNELFPLGYVKILKRPTNQANVFMSYNWARIYPSSYSPKCISYTVGISIENSFVVKIDTVGINDNDVVRSSYLDLRDPARGNAKILSSLGSKEGLIKSMEELVEWSIAEIRGFSLTYDEVAHELGIEENKSDEGLIQHFDSKTTFKEFRATWSDEQSTRFCQLVRAVHIAGLDWWHVNINNQVRFGRKNPGSDSATAVLGIVDGNEERVISWRAEGEGSELPSYEPFTDKVVKNIETFLSKNRESYTEWLKVSSQRPGLLPDQFQVTSKIKLKESSEGENLAIEESERPFNRIYYGPPGTGKTYKLTQLLKSEYQESTATVALEEWQNQFILENFSHLPWWQGAAAALYALDGNASVPKLFSHPIIQAIAKAKGRNKGVKQTLWGTMQSHALEISKTVGTKQKVAPAVFDKSADSEWHFAGDSDDACSEIFELVEQFNKGPVATETITRFSFVTFHQSYGYEEFVEGLRPILESENDSGEVRYEIKPGVFKQLCQKARQSPNKRFAMVIDEINRGNISKIFGELITLIEHDKREGMENAIALTLPYSGESFSVPANVDIIGTMNTADRSLALIDTALRRRFEFIEVMPNSSDEIGSPLHSLRVNVNSVEINIPELLNVINLRIEALYDRDHTIGHAYFTTLKTLSDGEQRFNGLQQIFRNKLLPLLEEYFFEDWHKIALVLADNRKTNDLQFIAEISDEGDDLTTLFGNDHGLDSYSTRRRFTVQDSAFLLPMAYTGIYELATS